MSEVPEDRCGFEMLAANLSPCTVASYDSLSEAVESERVAVCCRPTTDDCNRCGWHADSTTISDIEELGIAPQKPTVLDGAHFSENTFETAQSFADILLRHADFSFSEAFNSSFSNSKLAGANFSQAKLSGVDFSGASLPNANLSEADLLEGDLSNTGLQSADLSETRLIEADISDAYMLGADLSSAEVSDADLSDTRLVEANLSESHLSGAILSDAWLIRANLSHSDMVNADLTGAHLTDANICKANLKDANVTDVDLHRADLSGADLRDANVTGTDLYQADLSGSNFRNADMIGTRLQEVNLRAANLERADLSKADVFDADLVGSKLYGAILSNIRINKYTRFGNHYADGDYNTDKAAWTLRQIEQISRESALPEQVAEAMIKRKTRRRKDHWKEGNYLSWLRNAGFGLLTKYGESPGRVVGLSIGTILVSSVFFQFFGIRDTTNGGEILTYALQNTTLPNLLGKSLYLSTVTFTTVSYGDLQPVGLGQLVATVESFLGALLMALLVFVLGRRATR